MRKKVKRVFKVYWVWQDDKEEIWLREMAQGGWLLKRYNIFFYTFEKTEPKDYVYKLHYKSTINTDMDEYLTIFQDAGWEHVTQYAGWHYFRTLSRDSETPEIYSDSHSKLQKYKALLKILIPIFSLNLLAGFNLVSHVNNRGFQSLLTFTKGLGSLNIALSILLIYGITRILFKMRSLNKGI